MSSLRSVVPPRTRQFIKDTIGLPQINERLGTLEERLGGVDQSIAAISADCTVKNALSEMRERLEESERRLARLLAAGEDPRKQFQIPYWYDTSFVEPCVALALRDLCRPGDVVFDVGANCGALSLLMSRLVGPRGVVCSFEASRRIVDKCQYNLAVNGCYNSQLFHCAVFSRSGEVLKIYHGSHLNDTVVAEYANTANFDTVETVSLDDFVDHFDLHPKFIKMDIEGAEYDALLGARHTIDNDRPMLVLEQQPGDTRCLDMLKGFDYAGIDLATYQEVACLSDFPSGVDLANVLFIPRSTLDQTPYRLPISRREVNTLEKSDFEVAPDRSVRLRQPIELDRGRYLIRTQFTAQGADNEAMAGVEADGETIFRYHTNTRFLSTAYRDWVIDLPRRQSVNLFLQFLNGTTDLTLDFSDAAVHQIDSFLNHQKTDFTE
jgi:FkbM family methyltransferase